MKFGTIWIHLIWFLIIELEEQFQYPFQIAFNAVNKFASVILIHVKIGSNRPDLTSDKIMQNF